MASGLSVVALVVVAIGLFVGRGPAAGLLCRDESRNFARLPEPAPPLDDDAVLRLGERRSIFLGDGRPLDADYRLDIQGRGVLEHVDTTFEWTDRRCGRVTGGYRFVTVRAVAPGQATVTQPLTEVRQLQVSVVR